jgi:hypothetical protein
VAEEDQGTEGTAGAEGAADAGTQPSGDAGGGSLIDDQVSAGEESKGSDDGEGSLIDDGDAGADGGEGADPSKSAEEAELEFSPEGGYTEFGRAEGVEYTQDDLGEAGDVFAGLNGGKGLSQTDAQTVIDFASRRVTRDAAAMSEAKANMESSWKKEVAADPTIGGDNFGASKATVRAAVQPSVKAEDGTVSGGVPGANELLAEARKVGLSNWPPLFRFLHGLGQGMSEDSHQAGNRAASGKADFRDFYASSEGAGDSA